MTVYRASPPSALIIRPLDSLTAIYDRASGQTHLLATPAPELIELLGREALTAEALMTRLSEQYELGDPDAEALAARLNELVSVGLVEAL